MIVCNSPLKRKIARSQGSAAKLLQLGSLIRISSPISFRHLNDAYQTDFTVEDKVDIETIHQKVHDHEELRQVIKGDNTETNKQYKFNRGDSMRFLLDFVNSKLELYTKLSTTGGQCESHSVNSIKPIVRDQHFPKWETPLSTGKMKEKPGNMKGKGRQ